MLLLFLELRDVVKLLLNHYAFFFVKKFKLLLKTNDFNEDFFKLAKNSITLLANATLFNRREEKNVIAIKTNTLDATVEVIINTTNFVLFKAI